MDGERITTQLWFDALASFAAKQKPSLSVAYPDVAFNPPLRKQDDGSTKPDPYIFVDVLFNDSSLEGVGHGESSQLSGLCTVNVVWPSGQGALKPLRLAGQMVEEFKPGSLLTREGVTARVYEKPRVAPAQSDNDRVTLPIIIRWVASVPPGP